MGAHLWWATGPYGVYHALERGSMRCLQGDWQAHNQVKGDQLRVLSVSAGVEASFSRVTDGNYCAAELEAGGLRPGQILLPSVKVVGNPHR